MRYLGIDFGKKRVGIALSDEGGQFAMAHSVLPNNESLIKSIGELCTKQKVGAIVMGESKNFKQEENVIMKEVYKTKEALEKATGLPVYLEPEFMTSAEAEHLQGKNAMLDASAAALILKSYLDKEAYKDEERINKQ